MKTLVSSVLAALFAGAVGVAAGYAVSSRRDETRMDRVVAFAWGDGKYGKAFYGAQVYLEPAPAGVSVRARVFLGRGNSYFHDCGEIGRAKDDAEAVAKWGRIDFRSDGLHVGDYYLPRERLEAHR